MDLLTDLQVVDCSSGIAGGYCAKLLSGAGAEVINMDVGDFVANRSEIASEYNQLVAG